MQHRCFSLVEKSHVPELREGGRCGVFVCGEVSLFGKGSGGRKVSRVCSVREGEEER